MKIIISGLSQIVFVLIICPSAMAIIVGYQGSEAKFWEKHAVVLGKIISNDTGKTELEVHAVVATDFAISTRIPVHYGFIPVDRKADQLLLVCIQRPKDTGDWIIPIHVLYLFESNCFIEPLNGLDDPKLEQDIQRIHAARWASFKNELVRFGDRPATTQPTTRRSSRDMLEIHNESHHNEVSPTTQNATEDD